MKDDLQVFVVLTRRKIRELCLGKPFLVVLFLQQTAFFFLQRDALLALESDGLMVAFHPSQYGIFVSVLLLGIFLHLYTAAEPSRERESGALETLFYGPVYVEIYLLSILTAVFAAMLVSFLNILGSLWIGVIFIGYEIPVSLFPLLPITTLCFCGISIAGILISVSFRQVRPAMIIVSILLILSLALSFGNFWFSRTDFSGSFAMVFLRRALSAVNLGLSFIFPLGLYIDDLSWFIEFGRIPVFHIFWYPIYGIGLFFLSIKVLKNRGVLAR